MRLRYIVLAGLTVTLIILAYFISLQGDLREVRETSVSPSEGVEVTREMPRISIGLLPIVDAIPFVIADAMGLYEKYGLNVSIQVFGSAKDRDAAFTAGLINVAINDPITTLMLADKGVDVRIVALLLGEHPRDGVFYLLAPPNSTIRLEDVKQIAVSRNTIIEFSAWLILERLGIDPRRVEFLDVPSIALRFQMLIEGKVEAAVLPDPWGSLAIAKGARLLASDSMFDEPITMSIIIANSKIASNEELVQRLVMVLNEALKLYKENPEAYRRIVEEKIYIPEELRGKWLPEWNGWIKAYPRGNFELVYKWLRDRGLVVGTLDYDRVVVLRD